MFVTRITVGGFDDLAIVESDCVDGVVGTTTD